jgi:KDO2-lipid IV(A) lauroyltransferase
MKRWYRLPLPKPIIYASQYVPARAALFLLQSLPYTVTLRIGTALAALAATLDVTHRRVIHQNLELAFASAPLDPPERRRIARAVFRHWGTLLADVPYLLRSLRRDNWTAFADPHAPDPLRRLHAEGRGAIVVTGHLGNPELGGWLAALAGLPIHSVANHLTNPWVNRLLERLRTGSGQQILYREGALREGVRVLERGEIVAFLADLHGRRRGLSIEFFGREVSTMQGPAVLAVRSGAPVLPVAIVRQGPGPRYHVEWGEPIRPIPGAPPGPEVHRVTQAYTKALERFIRLWPEQWIWFHGRWKKSRPARPGGPPVIGPHVPMAHGDVA